MNNALILLYFLALLAGLVGGAGDALLNQWVKVSPKLVYLAGGYVCWMVAVTLFIIMLKKGMLANCVILFLLANCAVALVTGSLIFDEHMSAKQWTGAVLAVIALILLQAE